MTLKETAIGLRGCHFDDVQLQLLLKRQSLPTLQGERSNWNCRQSAFLLARRDKFM